MAQDIFDMPSIRPLPLVLLSVCPLAVACSIDVDVAASSESSEGTAPESSSGMSNGALESSTGEPEPSTTGAPGTTTPVGESSSSSGEATGGLPVFDLGTGETGVVTDMCDEDAPDIIYVLAIGDFVGYSDGSASVWSFDPIAIEYEHVVDVNCPEITGQISGLAVGRDGVLTVLSWELYEVNAPMQLARLSADGTSCEVVFQDTVDEGAISCGDLALVAEEASVEEQMFMHSCTGGGFTITGYDGSGSLFRGTEVDDGIDLELLATNDYTSVTIAGTGDGRLFGMSGDQDAPDSMRLIEFDRETGTRTETPTPGLSLGDFGAYFAMAFYGGDFYTFGAEVDDDSSIHTVVSRYDFDDDDGNGEHEVTALPDTDLRIFAAASPTCIPLTPAG